MSVAHKPSSPPADRCILPEALYTLAALSVRTGLGTFALRSARREGLRVFRVGGRAFVRGADFIEYVVKAGNGEGRADEH